MEKCQTRLPLKILLIRIACQGCITFLMLLWLQWSSIISSVYYPCRIEPFIFKHFEAEGL